MSILPHDRYLGALQIAFAISSDNLEKGTHLMRRSLQRKFHRSIVPVACLAVIGAAFLLPMPANAEIVSTDKLKVSGDFRFRLEQDWDSQNSSGVKRDDRLRARIRARLAMAYKANDTFEFGLRLRSGSDSSHQSPHITVVDFDGNNTGDSDFNLDKYYIKAKSGGFWGWAGRNGNPIWKPNEMLWDDDVTPIGLALGYDTGVGSDSKLGFKLGQFSLPAGMQGACGELTVAQAVLNTKLGGAGLTIATGINEYEKGSVSDSDCGLYLQSNGERDYSIWTTNVKFSTTLNDRAFSIGVDLMRNGEDYALTDPGITPENQNDTDGWDAYVTYGGTSNKGDWLFGYWYANIEQFAVNNSFSQDDWMRWGNATQTRSSDFKGHELRAAVGLAKGLNLVARLYIVESINSIEDGNRFRIDLNWKF